MSFPNTPSAGTTHTIGDITWEWNGYAWEVVVSTIAGLSGPRGNTGATGVGISGTTLTNYELIITYTNGITQNVGYIRGDTGAPGTPGAAGTAGAAGAAGSQGIQGNTGPAGTTGATGPTGASITNVRQENGELLVEIDGGQEINVGFLPLGPTGPTGPAGSGGGGAAGTKTYAIFTPLNNEPPATNYATIDTRNSITVLDFDGTTQESAVFRSIMPEGASFSSLVAYIWAMATTAITGDVIWGVQYEDMNASDLDTDSFSTGVTKAMTIAATSGVPLGITISTSSFDGITVGDPYRVKIYRAAAEAGDTLVGDAEFLAVEIRGA